MLVLTRKVSERITIAHGLIEILVLAIHGDRVQLGITAPMDMPINREEVERRPNHGRIEHGPACPEPEGGAA